jgi:uncharacterized protein YecA (UPF0149 family)
MDESTLHAPLTSEELDKLADFLDSIPDNAMNDAVRVRTPLRRDSPKVGRNDPCPCGSGRKYKQCCGKSPDALH